MKILAFIKKDFLITISYKFKLLLGLGSLLINVVLFYYIGKTFSNSISDYLKAYGGDYFPYVLIGIAVSSFVSVGLNALAFEIRKAQVKGTLEALLCTPNSIYLILIGNSLWSFITAFLSSFGLILGGIIFLNIQIQFVEGFVTLGVLFLTFIAFIEVGMLSASFIMIFKQGDPISLLFGSSSYFLGGIFFPVEVLPLPFQYISKILPITHSIQALRELLLAQSDITDVFPLIINLIIFILILLPVSILFFSYSVKRAKKDGSLIQF
jgi:ABC-2 type transport system permease protein